MKNVSCAVTTTESTKIETTESTLSAEKPGGPFDKKKNIQLMREKGKKKQRDENLELATVLKASLEERNEGAGGADSDEDRLFLLSLLTHLKKVPENSKLRARVEMMNVLIRHTHSEPSHTKDTIKSSPSTRDQMSNRITVSHHNRVDPPLILQRNHRSAATVNHEDNVSESSVQSSANV